MKTCSKCGVEKELTEFYVVKSTLSRKRSETHNWCKACCCKYEQTRRAASPKTARLADKRRVLKKKYGMQLEDKDQILLEQHNCCAVCGDEFLSSSHAHIDHIHGTEPAVVRGILCRGCNTGLGNFKDSPVRLLKAISYLKKFL